MRRVLEVLRSTPCHQYTFARRMPAKMRILHGEETRYPHVIRHQRPQLDLQSSHARRPE